MTKKEQAIACIMRAHEYAKNNPDKFKDTDEASYIADDVCRYYDSEKNVLSLEEYQIDEEKNETSKYFDRGWDIAQLIYSDLYYPFVERIDDHLYYRYRECKAYQKAMQRDLTEEEIGQFLCSDCSYENRSLDATHSEFNYPLIVFNYQMKDGFHFCASFPGYENICGHAKEPQDAVEIAYQNLAEELAQH